MPPTTITPMLAVNDAARAIAFYQAAFGAKETFRLTDPAGTVVHAEMKIGEAAFMLAEENPKYLKSPTTIGGTPVVLQFYHPDVDVLAAQAVKAGAQLVIPIADQFYGDRSGRLKDLFGHLWIVSTRKEEVAPEEMQRRFAAMMK